jgi:hypothetical protein
MRKKGFTASADFYPLGADHVSRGSNHGAAATAFVGLTIMACSETIPFTQQI